MWVKQLPEDGKCPKCKGTLEIEDTQGVSSTSDITLRCLNCGNRIFHALPPPTSSFRPAPRRPISQDPNAPPDESTASLNHAIHWVAQQEKEKRKIFQSCANAQDRPTLKKQIKLYEALEKTLQCLKNIWFDKKSSFLGFQASYGYMPPNVSPEFDQAFKSLMSLMLIAEKHGLGQDPIVRNWLAMRRLQGDRDYLRSARRGLERGIKRPYPNVSEMELDLEIRELDLKGKSLRQIEEILKHKNLFHQGKPLSHTAIVKRLKRLRKEYPS